MPIFSTVYGISQAIIIPSESTDKSLLLSGASDGISSAMTAVIPQRHLRAVLSHK